MRNPAVKPPRVILLERSEGTSLVLMRQVHLDFEQELLVPGYYLLAGC
jgi:hypothetical protein